MNPHVEGDSRTVKPFKFSDSFLAGFNALITTYDKKIEDLNKVKSLIDKDAHHGVCNCSYKMRYITPSDISTFISNLERAMENHLFKPHTSDCDLFAVESVKRFLNGNGCVPFDAATIMGNPGADIPKGATLADLTFAAESENFGLLVYSKYELDKRVDCMREDIGTIQNMHFSAAVKSFVQKLPDIMNKKATFVMKDSLLAKACEVYIEDFIMFAVRLNLTTVLQMLAYAIPRVAYKNEPIPCKDSNESANNADNWDEDNDFFKMESVDSTKVSPVFFVFTKGNSAISKAIKKATDSEYSHISISFDPSLDAMYSFGGSSFRKESIHDKERKDLDIDVYGTFITKNGVDAMQDMCADFISNMKKTKFDYPALIKRLFGSDKKDNTGYKQICTTFVNKLLGEAGTSLSDKNIPSPEEMRETAQAKEDQIFQLYTGNSKDYKRKAAADKLKKMGKNTKAKAFNEYVTECCSGFLKTNDYVITNKIPFNCNMRDIVLQDMHPQFKDTVSALKFIMNDERSPIHQLVIQYYTEPIDDYDPDLIIKMFFGCCHHSWDDPNSRDGIANDKANMNTDVNWLDKITYGNMFLDGNYRRDGLGNQHTHPIMNSFETIYKMFGGCDNVCDNAGLSNSLIRISRVMKAIVERYCEGCISNWEMCRDILAVFGEIFTRHMLRLYYNNNHYIPTTDQMRDTIVPGYMYAESFVLEADGMTSMNKDNHSAGKVVKVTIGNVIKTMINWFGERLAKFMPEKFNTTYQTNVKWFNENGQKRFNEIQTAVQNNKFNLPKKKDYKTYQVSFNPDKVNVGDIVKKAVESNDTIDEKFELNFRKQLLNVFPGEKGGEQLAENLAKLKGDALKKGMTNAILYSKTEDVPSKGTDYQLTLDDFKDIYGNLEFICKDNNKTWNVAVENFSKSLIKGLNDLKTEYKITESFEINPDGMFLQEMDEKTPDDSTAENSDADKAAAEKKTRAQHILNILRDVSDNAYSTSVNTIVSNLFVDCYSTFKFIVDDFDKTNPNQNTTPSDATQTNANNT